MAMIILHIREYFRKRKGTFLTLYAILQDSDKTQLRDAEFIGYITKSRVVKLLAITKKEEVVKS